MTFTPKVKRVVKNEQELLRLGFSLMREKRLEEAQEQFEEVLENNPTSKGALLAMGGLHLRQRSYDQALANFQTLMKSDPIAAQGPLGVGQAYLGKGELDKALTNFQNAINLDPKLTQAYLGLGRVMLAKEKPEEAIQQFRKALRLDPQLSFARVGMAQAYNRQGNSDEALSELKAAQTMDAKNWMVHMQMGGLYLRQQNYRDAKLAYEEAFSLNPEVPAPMRLGLVEALIQNNDLDEAAQMLKELPQNPQLAPRIHKFWGDIYQQKGMAKEAAEEYRAATLLAAEDGKSLDDLNATDLDTLSSLDQSGWEKLADNYRTSASTLIRESAERRRAEGGPRRNR